MRFRFKKWHIIFIIIPIVILFGIIKSQIDSQTSKDGTYYLVVKHQSTKTASLDKTSWVKIEGNQLLLNENGEETSYNYDAENETFEKDSMTYFCLFSEGTLTIGTHDDDATDLTTYVSPASSMYSAYEEGTVKITE